ncbi:MAG: hypothetical protein BWZ10_01411 [candidate division BRC1 bacterium ADurb.BinA364]|nr:MAG: hypothetical protein BWZ10_01411 [candidate division BRC1 bacterium ADurb.BinA364]
MKKVRLFIAGVLSLAFAAAFALGMTNRRTAIMPPKAPVLPPPIPGRPFTIPAPPKPIEMQITERQMVEAATITGIELSNGELWLNYDPTKPLGKQACPT